MEKKYQLAPYVRAGIKNGTVGFGFGSIFERVEDSNFQKVLLSICQFWLKPHSYSEVESFFFQEEKKLVRKIIDFLSSGHYLLESEIFDKDDRYSRNKLYYSLSGGDAIEVQKNIEKSHAIILGCGGIGNLVAVALATAGIGRLTLIDNDLIEYSNLTRQFLFNEDDIGKNKVDVLQKELHRRNPKTIINTLKLQITAEKGLSDLPKCNIIVLSADKPANLIRWVNAYSIRTKTPFINIGYVEDIVTWGPLVIPEVTSCWECNSLIIDSDDSAIGDLIREINENYQAPSNPVTNTIASGCGVGDILKFLGRFGDIQSLNQKVAFFTYKPEIRTYYSVKNANCSACGNK